MHCHEKIFQRHISLNDLSCASLSVVVLGSGWLCCWPLAPVSFRSCKLCNHINELDMDSVKEMETSKMSKKQKRGSSCVSISNHELFSDQLKVSMDAHVRACVDDRC